MVSCSSYSDIVVEVVAEGVEELGAKVGMCVPESVSQSQISRLELIIAKVL